MLGGTYQTPDLAGGYLRRALGTNAFSPKSLNQPTSTPSPSPAPTHTIHYSSSCTSPWPRLIPSLLFVPSVTCCLRMLSSSALRSRPGQAQIRASKQRRPRTWPLRRKKGVSGVKRGKHKSISVCIINPWPCTSNVGGSFMIKNSWCRLKTRTHVRTYALTRTHDKYDNKYIKFVQCCYSGFFKIFCLSMLKCTYD